MPEETSAGCIVFRQENNEIKYLLLHYQEGHWDFPKGHVITGEKLEETAMRETKEETGFDVNLVIGFKQVYAYFYRKKDGSVVNKTVYFFLAKSDRRDVKLSFEHIGYSWNSYDNAMKKLTYDNAREVLKKAHDFLVQKRLI